MRFRYDGRKAECSQRQQISCGRCNWTTIASKHEKLIRADVSSWAGNKCGSESDYSREPPIPASPRASERQRSRQGIYAGTPGESKEQLPKASPTSAVSASPSRTYAGAETRVFGWAFQ